MEDAAAASDDAAGKIFVRKENVSFENCAAGTHTLARLIIVAGMRSSTRRTLFNFTKHYVR